jgi:hypothetical protein
MDAWEMKGCDACRTRWLQGNHPPKLGVNHEKHSFLHRCEQCGTYWEQFERYVDVISQDAARVEYGDVINGA